MLALAPAARPAEPSPAATVAELARLRAAYAGEATPGHAVVADLVARAGRDLANPVVFPPEGGHHNQWYQCERCQLALATVDARHHRCGKCGSVYSGFPYDNVVYSREHRRNASRASDFAWAFAVTGREEFAARAVEVLVGYGERYRNYDPIAASVGKPGWARILANPWAVKTYGRVLSQTLSEAAWVIPLVEAYELVGDAMTEGHRKTVCEGLFRPIAERLVRAPLGKSNWQTWHDAALLWLGAALGDEGLVRRAIHDPENGFEYQMGAAVTGDGMWDEGSWGYHYYTLSALTWLAEGARRLGLDLYGHPALRKMYLLGPRYRMPDGSLPRFGDDVQSRPDRPFENEAAFAAYGAEELLAALPSRPTLRSVLLGRTRFGGAVAPPPESELFPDAGHAILRTAGPGRLAAAATFGPYGGYHGHLDKLSFVLFGFGEELGVDPGRAASQAYRLPIHSRWYKATISHNAVLVDGRGQRPATGKLVASDLDAESPWVIMDAGKAYPGVRHRRLLLLTEAYLLVLDEIVAEDDRPRAFTWLWHGRGTVTAAGEPADAALIDAPGFEFLDDLRAYIPDGDATAVISTGNTDVHLRISGAAGVALLTATGPFRSVTDRAPLIARTSAGTTVRFLVAVEPVPAGQPTTVTTLSAEFGEDEVVIRAGGDEPAEWTVPWPPGR